MATWDETAPAGTDLVSGGDDAIRQLKTDIRERMDNEHVWTSTGTNAEGTHAAGFLTNAMVNAAAAVAESKLAFDSSAGHRHDGSTGGRKVLVTNLNPIGLTANRLVQANSGLTALESTAAPVINDFTNATHVHGGTSSGGVLSHNNLTSIGTNTHAQIDTFIGNNPAAHTVITDTLAANVTMPTGVTWYDGPSVSLVAGTWLVFASMDFDYYNSCGVKAQLLSGATVLGIAFTGVSDFSTWYGPFGGHGQVTPPVVMNKCLVLTGTTTVKMQGYVTTGGYAQILGGSGTTYITAVRIA